MLEFSVLMSVYHKENPQFLKLSIDSNIEKQTLKPTEFVLICDGPLNKELDQVINISQVKYGDMFKVFRLDKNGGLGKALNYGLTKCQYEIIARSDSDDICSPDRFEKQVRYLESHLDIAVLGTEISEFDEDPSQIKNYKKMPAYSDDVYRMCLFRCPVNHMTVMFRKSVIEKVGSYIHLQYIEDYFLWVRVFAAGYKIENLQEALVAARVGNGMVKRRGSKAYIKSWHVMNVFMKQHNMINSLIYLRNMLSVIAFVYMPVGLKEFLYKKVLRR